MSKDIQRLRGTIDIYYEYAQQFVAVVDNCTKLAKLHGYKYIETPVIEPKSLFVSSVGESSDIVKKEFYDFADKGGREIVLRPEGTASVPTDTIRVQNSMPPSGNKFAVAAADLTDIIKAEDNELQELQHKVLVFIKTLPGPPQIDARVMHLRYVDCFEWHIIINLLGYTERQVFRIHRRILEELPEE